MGQHSGSEGTEGSPLHSVNPVLSKLRDIRANVIVSGLVSMAEVAFAFRDNMNRSHALQLNQIMQTLDTTYSQSWHLKVEHLQRLNHLGTVMLLKARRTTHPAGDVPFIMSQLCWQTFHTRLSFPSKEIWGHIRAILGTTWWLMGLRNHFSLGL